MKIKEILEEQRVIEGDITLPEKTTKLDFEGATIKGNFTCYQTRVTSLKGAPSRVEGNCRFGALRLRSLKGCPSYVGGFFECSGTKITSLEGAPEYTGHDFWCGHTKIRSLHDVHKQIKYIGGSAYLSHTIISNVLGLILIKGLKKIGFVGPNDAHIKVQLIINKHLKGDRDVHACQEEMLEAGLVEYAKL